MNKHLIFLDKAINIHDFKNVNNFNHFIRIYDDVVKGGRDFLFNNYNHFIYILRIPKKVNNFIHFIRIYDDVVKRGRHFFINNFMCWLTFSNLHFSPKHSFVYVNVHKPKARIPKEATKKLSLC